MPGSTEVCLPCDHARVHQILTVKNVDRLEQGGDEQDAVLPNLLDVNVLVALFIPHQHHSFTWILKLSIDRQEGNNSHLTSGGMEQVNDVVDGLVGLVAGGLDITIRAVGRVGFVMEAAVGEGATGALVKEQEQ